MKMQNVGVQERNTMDVFQLLKTSLLKRLLVLNIL